VNRTSALWREPKHQITEEQYNEFYKLISHDSQAPQLKLHFSADAPLQFSALLFIPSAGNPEMLAWQRRVSCSCMSRVLIDGENRISCRYLRFVKACRIGRFALSSRETLRKPAAPVRS
jgi:molecular chaperone HtpG